MDWLEDDTGLKNKWESRYEQSWEFLHEDEHGSLTTAIQSYSRQKYLKYRRAVADKVLRKGILRQMCIVLDSSKAANEQDYSPSRGKVIKKLLKSFSRSYFEQNPLCQLGVVEMKDGVARRVGDLVGNPKDFNDTIDGDSTDGSGESSIHNALTVVQSSLSHLPSHGNKEVLLLFSGVSTCDFSSLLNVIDSFKAQKLRISCISLSGEIYVLKRLCEKTNGRYEVPLNEDHLGDLLQSFVAPFASEASEKSICSYLVQMGFPVKIGGEDRQGLCVCHGTTLEASSGDSGFSCPRCLSRVCQVPMDCPACGLTLVTSPFLAKSFHHLFPVAPFSLTIGCSTELRCFSCARPWIADHPKDTSFYSCTRCLNSFCPDCDTLIHDSLFFCPACLEG